MNWNVTAVEALALVVIAGIAIVSLFLMPADSSKDICLTGLGIIGGWLGKAITNSSAEPKVGGPT